MSGSGWRLRLAEVRQRDGWRAAAQLVVDRLGKRLLGLDVAHLIWLPRDAMQISLEAESGLEWRFLTAEEVADFGHDATLELDADTVLRASGRYDFCYAALDEGRLAAYGWYALGAIEAEHAGGVAMSYPTHVAYMYKGFTHPDYRGRRLHALAMGRALVALEAFGVDTLLSIVDWTNRASLKSCARLGYQDLGRRLKLGGDNGRLILSPPRVRELGVELGRDADKLARRLRAVDLGSQEPGSPEQAEELAAAH